MSVRLLPHLSVKSVDRHITSRRSAAETELPVNVVEKHYTIAMVRQPEIHQEIEPAPVVERFN